MSQAVVSFYPLVFVNIFLLNSLRFIRVIAAAVQYSLRLLLLLHDKLLTLLLMPLQVDVIIGRWQIHRVTVNTSIQRFQPLSIRSWLLTLHLFVLPATMYTATELALKSHLLVSTKTHAWVFDKSYVPYRSKIRKKYCRTFRKMKSQNITEN